MATRHTLIALCLVLIAALIVQISKQRNKLNNVRIQLKQCEEQSSTTFELYWLQRDEVLRLEQENQILGSYAAQKENNNDEYKMWISVDGDTIYD